eukprot:NODE_1830_length_1788_cov_72.032432_g1550_i0.p1 GENE.NODE_1830_length_1788_cov_72.032432_g1550_i0~~NODE_1830_length_1788_cov_72.032432_g1550_i0.p1  ORF type:complete len:465 (+),score=128.04 NODE_1830_length_1788_cov_72.032432_g1550_i0:204-1397(+)
MNDELTAMKSHLQHRLRLNEVELAMTSQRKLMEEQQRTLVLQQEAAEQNWVSLRRKERSLKEEWQVLHDKRKGIETEEAALSKSKSQWALHRQSQLAELESKWQELRSLFVKPSSPATKALDELYLPSVQLGPHEPRNCEIPPPRPSVEKIPFRFSQIPECHEMTLISDDTMIFPNSFYISPLRTPKKINQALATTTNDAPTIALLLSPCPVAPLVTPTSLFAPCEASPPRQAQTTNEIVISEPVSSPPKINPKPMPPTASTHDDTEVPQPEATLTSNVSLAPSLPGTPPRATPKRTYNRRTPRPSAKKSRAAKKQPSAVEETPQQKIELSIQSPTNEELESIFSVANSTPSQSKQRKRLKPAKRTQEEESLDAPQNKIPKLSAKKSKTTKDKTEKN